MNIILTITIEIIVFTCIQIPKVVPVGYNLTNKYLNSKKYNWIQP